MAEYISKYQLHEITKPFKDSFLSFLTDEVDRLVDTMKPADVQPVKHGKWSQIKILQDGYKAKECSACKATFWDLYHWNYCPNCGARMGDET